MPGGGTRIYSCEHGQQFKAILVAKRLHIQLWAPTGRKPMAKVQVPCPMAGSGGALPIRHHHDPGLRIDHRLVQAVPPQCWPHGHQDGLIGVVWLPSQSG